MLRTQEAPGRDGVYLAGVTRGARIIEVDVLMIDRSHSSLRQRVEEVASILDRDEPVPMEIADEPDRIRYVILSEETDLEEIVHTGRTTLRFFMPDPWKVSKEENFKGITSPPVTFERQSTADDPEGMVPPQQPRYREGKFGQGIFIEEGTTNLLSTPENPAVEEVDVQAGETYTLSHDMGRVEVGHHREEDLSAGEFHNVRLVEGKLVLNKYGEDRKEDLKIAEGGHFQTVYDPEKGWIQLGTETEGPTSLTHDEGTAEWAGGQNSGVQVEKGSIIMNNFPDWEETDNLTDYVKTGWEARIKPTRVTQTANTVRMDSYLNESVALVKEMPGRSDLRSIEFLYYLTTPPEPYDETAGFRTQFIWVLDTPMPGDESRRVAFYPTLFQEASINGKYPGYAWVRLVITRMPVAGDGGNVDVYINGQYNRSLPASGSTLSPRFQFIMENEMQGRFYLADFKFSSTSLHETQSSYLFPLTGERVTPDIELNDLGEYRDSSVTYSWRSNSDLPAGAEDYEHQVGLEADVYVNPIVEWSGYEPVVNGKIPQLESGQSLAGKKVRFRARLQSFDNYRSPYLDGLSVTVEGFRSETYTSGTWTADPIPLDGVGRACRATLNYIADTPLLTRVVAEVALEVDGILGEWVVVGNGEEIPALTRKLDLTGARLHVRFHLSGTTRTSPHLESVEVDLVSAFVEEGVRISPVTDLSSIRRAADSFAGMVQHSPEGTRVIYEAQLGDGVWQEITADILPGIETGDDLQGVTLRTRLRLSADPRGEQTPAVLAARWRVDQEMSGENGVTRLVPATAQLVLTPVGVRRWQLEAREYGTSFHPDTRKPEVLWFPAPVALNEGEGTLSLWAYEDGIPRRKYLLDTDGEFRFSIYRSEGMEGYRVRVNNEPLFDLPLPPTGQFNQIVVRWSGNEVAAFINGVLQDSSSLSEPVSFAEASRLYLGSDRLGNAQWNERLDEVHFSSVARPDAYLTDPERLTQPEAVDRDTAYLLRFDASLADSSTILIHEGSAPTLPRFEVSIEREMDDLKILHIETGRFLLIQGTLKPGDTVLLGDPGDPVRINGHPRKQWLSLDSDFFRLVKGDNTFEVTEGAQVIAYWRERWK